MKLPLRTVRLTGQPWKRFTNIPMAASRSYRRYATIPDHPAYKDAEDASRPKAVKDRRNPRHHHAKEGIDLPPLKNNPSMGEQPGDPSTVRTYRLRGIKDGQVIGQRIYLPNFIIRMVRNGVKPGDPYNPYKATFHVPLSVTKNDIKSYLLAVYGVETTYVNTEIPHQKGQKRRQLLKTFKPKPRFKRAIVGLVEPFYYPEDPADMSALEFQEYEDEQTDRGRTVLERMRKMSLSNKLRSDAQAGNPGQAEDAKKAEEIAKEIARERDRRRLESVTPEVVSRLVSTPVEQQ
jgi:ribosomal protein L23